MCPRSLVLTLSLLVVLGALPRHPAAAMPGLAKPAVEQAGAIVTPVFFRRGPSGVLCERKWSRIRGWYDRCLRYDYSPGNIQDLRAPPSLRARCWANRDGYAYCPDAHTWDRRYVNRRCYIDRRGQPHCIPPKEARFPGKTGP